MSKGAEKPKIWENLLKEAIQEGKAQDGTLVLFGPKGSGKRTLLNTIQALKGMGEERKVKDLSYGIEYGYLDVFRSDDAEKDVIGRVNIWFFDDIAHKDLLDVVFTKESIKNMIVAFVLDFSENWNFMSALNDWMVLCSEKIGQALKEVPLQEQDDLRNKLYNSVRDYKDPGQEEAQALRRRATRRVSKVGEVLNTEEMKEVKTLIPLPPGVLTINYGIPFMVICNKSDLVEAIERDKDGENRLDFIAYTLRGFCIQYAATLIYTSSKQNINIDILCDYLFHRMFDLPLIHRPDILHKDSVFLPAGYDSPKIINETYTNFVKNTTLPYDEVVKPPPKKLNTREDVVAEDGQVFLQKLKETLKSTRVPTSSAGAGNPENEEKPAEAPERPSERHPPAANGPQDTTQFFSRLISSTPRQSDANLRATVEQDLLKRSEGEKKPETRKIDSKEADKLLEIIKSKSNVKS